MICVTRVDTDQRDHTTDSRSIQYAHRNPREKVWSGNPLTEQVADDAISLFLLPSPTMGGPAQETFQIAVKNSLMIGVGLERC